MLTAWEIYKKKKCIFLPFAGAAELWYERKDVYNEEVLQEIASLRVPSRAVVIEDIDYIEEILRPADRFVNSTLMDNDIENLFVPLGAEKETNLPSMAGE